MTLIRLVAAVGAGLLLTATMTACGDDQTGKLTVPEYLQSLQIVTQQAADDAAFLNEEDNREKWFNDLDATRDLVSRSLAASEATLASLHRLNPPDALAVPHRNMTTAFETIVEASQGVKTDVQAAQTVDELHAIQATFPKPGVRDAAMQFKEACEGLERYGEEQGIVVDLHCDEI